MYIACVQEGESGMGRDSAGHWYAGTSHLNSLGLAEDTKLLLTGLAGDFGLGCLEVTASLLRSSCSQH